MEDDISHKISNAAKWSTMTEVMAKLITPLSSMILARVLVPEVFGIVASVNMVISFCDLFADAGFQKYIIQHKDEQGIEPYVNVAFWTNLVVSASIWMLVALLSEPIARLVGCPGKNLAVIVACANLPLHAFTSIQTAILKRNMNFKPLFFVRIVTIVTPIIITVPLAILTKSYWAMIIGTIVANAGTVIVVERMLKWHPAAMYSFVLLKKMFSFSIWSMIESLLVWLLNWGDVFIVGQILTQHYLGLYKTSMGLVNQVISVISASMVPVLLSALSNLQDDEREFKKTFYRFSYLSGLLLIPMSVGIWLYQDTLCIVGLGQAWIESATLIGVWGFISAIAILFNSYNGVVLIAKGKPSISVAVQIIQIAAIIPAVYWSAQKDFVTLSYTRALVRMVGMIAYCVVVYRIADIRITEMLKKLLPSFVATLVMALVGGIIKSFQLGVMIEMLSIVLCVCVYAGMLMVFPSTRLIIGEGFNTAKIKLRVFKK